MLSNYGFVDYVVCFEVEYGCFCCGVDCNMIWGFDFVVDSGCEQMMIVFYDCGGIFQVMVFGIVVGDYCFVLVNVVVQMFIYEVYFNVWQVKKGRVV